MSKLDKKGPLYYVYQHVEPDGTVVYVGKGSKGRAWDSRPSTRANEAHCQWMDEQILDQNNFVRFIASRLISSDALNLEREVKAILRPKFNIY